MLRVGKPPGSLLSSGLFGEGGGAFQLHPKAGQLHVSISLTCSGSCREEHTIEDDNLQICNAESTEEAIYIANEPFLKRLFLWFHDPSMSVCKRRGD